jgi:hypothetical protein
MSPQRLGARSVPTLFRVNVGGDWSAPEWDTLLAWVDDAALPPGSQVVLDFSEARHMHFRTAPRLLEIAHKLEQRGAVPCVVGLSEYLRRIVEVACALEGRDFLERHGLGAAARPDAAETRRGAPTLRPWRPWGRQDLAVPSAN